MFPLCAACTEFLMELSFQQCETVLPHHLFPTMKAMSCSVSSCCLTVSLATERVVQKIEEEMGIIHFDLCKFVASLIVLKLSGQFIIRNADFAGSSCTVLSSSLFLRLPPYSEREFY